MFNETNAITKRDLKDKTLKTNCYVCGCDLTLDEAKRSPDNESDSRIFCPDDWKKRYGKKKRLLKRY